MYNLISRSEEQIIVTDADLERLTTVLYHHGDLVSEPLEAELHRATIVAQRDVPADIVTMNSEVVYEDAETGARRAVVLVYPKDADARSGRVSVLAPVGAALLGLRVGQEIVWRVVNGDKRIRVVEIRYQPESAGDFAR
jgi:regulator of nucleoside diphosphate kinase